RDSRRLGVGVQLNYQLTPQTQLFAEVAREREYENDPGSLDMSLNSVSGDGFELQGHTPADGQTTGLVGVSHTLAGQLKLVGSYHFRGTEDRQHGVNIGLSLDW
ncbi:MAG TPA: autotransporter domain-containing esterase, partial [Pseudomonas sp.]|nr:autotransporter domain-containing esterase [Pseudomonas sp.]